jgi:sugar lactone lactonase YvrE
MVEMTNCRHIPVRLPLILFCAVLMLSSCTSSQFQEESAEVMEAPLVWPSPPSEPRIAFERIFEEPDDISARKGFFKGLAEFFLGKESSRIIKPYGITVDTNGRVIIADTALKRIHIFDVNKRKYTWHYKVGRDELLSPVGVASDMEGNIYISDSDLKKVFVLSKSGRLLSTLKGDFSRPTGLAIDRNARRLYVVDTWDHNIKVYDLDGASISTIGGRGAGEGKFNYPTDVSVDRDGLIYVSDSMNFRIQIFARDGQFISMFGRHGDGSGDLARPKGIGVDSAGHIFVVDALFDAVQIFDRDGQYLLGFGTTGQERGRFWLPGGLFIDEDDTIYVADAYNRRVQVFKHIASENGEQTDG